jgi:uncharacterized membrane protein YozB (DUF420 family)
MKVLSIIASVLGLINGGNDNSQAYQQIIAERDLQIKRMKYTIWLLLATCIGLVIYLIIKKK